jgi:hypothetical protein
MLAIMITLLAQGSGTQKRENITSLTPLLLAASNNETSQNVKNTTD